MKKALVIKVKKKYIVVLDDESRYLRMKRKDGIREGQQIFYTDKDMYRKRRVNLRMALAAAAALALVSFTLTTQLPTANAIPLMTVSIDVNPSVEMDVDRDLIVTEVRAMNEEAKALIRNKWKSEEYGSVLEEYFEELKANGYLKDNDEVLFGYAWLDQEHNPDREMQETLQSTGQDVVDGMSREMEREIGCLHVQTSEQERLQARENQESIGKYTVMNRLRMQLEPGKESPNIGDLTKAYRNYTLEQEKENERKNQMQENEGTEDGENGNQQIGKDDANDDGADSTKGSEDSGKDQQQGNKSTDSDGGQNSSGGSGGK